MFRILIYMKAVRIPEKAICTDKYSDEHEKGKGEWRLQCSRVHVRKEDQGAAEHCAIQAIDTKMSGVMSNKALKFGERYKYMAIQ